MQVDIGFGGIDTNDLRKQKSALLLLTSLPGLPKEYEEHLDGLIHMIDAIQDRVIEQEDIEDHSLILDTHPNDTEEKEEERKQQWIKEEQRVFGLIRQELNNKKEYGSMPAKLVTTITVVDPDTNGDVEIEIYKEENSGGMVGIDASYLASTFEVAISPYHNGVLTGDGLDIEE